MPTVLIVDDDAAVRTLLAALIERDGMACDFAVDGSDAIAKIRRNGYDAIILDLFMPIASGFDVIQYMRCERKELLARTIVVTAASDRTLAEFDRSVVGAVLRKPFDIRELIATVRASLDHSNKER